MPCYLPPNMHGLAFLSVLGRISSGSPSQRWVGFLENIGLLTVSGGNIKDRIEEKLCACICAFGLGLYICKCMWRSEIDVSVFLS